MHCMENKFGFLGKFLKVEDKDMKLIAADNMCLWLAEVRALLSLNRSSTRRLELEWIAFEYTHYFHSCYVLPQAINVL